MAFDLVKLHILQDALDRIKATEKLGYPVYSVCTSILIESTKYGQFKLDLESESAEDNYVIPHVFNVLKASLKVKGHSIAYLWPMHRSFIKDRIKYLERLIEDEMSGVYSGL